MRTDRGPPRLLYWASANVPGVKLWQNICAGRGVECARDADERLSAARQIIARLAARSISSVSITSQVEHALRDVEPDRAESGLSFDATEKSLKCPDLARFLISISKR